VATVETKHSDIVFNLTTCLKRRTKSPRRKLYFKEKIVIADQGVNDIGWSLR
jgi:hypothetical protein